MIEFTDLFHPALPFLIVIQPALNHLALFRVDTELPVTTARIAHRQNPHLVPFTRFTTRTTFLVKDGTFQQRSPEDLLRRRQLGHNLPALLDYFLVLHL